LRRDFDAHLVLPLQVARNAVGKVRAGGTLLFMGGTDGRRAAALHRRPRWPRRLRGR